MIPILLRIPGLVDKVFRGQKAFMALLDELVTEHRMTRDPAQPPRDLTDTFLDQVEKVRGNGQDRCRAGGSGCCEAQPDKVGPVHPPPTRPLAARDRMGDHVGASVPLSHSSVLAQAKGNPESSFNDDNLRLVVADLFVAGMFTTSFTLSWALLLMILHPDVQREPSWSCGECGSGEGSQGLLSLAWTHCCGDACLSRPGPAGDR